MEQAIEPQAIGRRAVLRRAAVTGAFSTIVSKSIAPAKMGDITDPDDIAEFRFIVDNPRHIHYCSNDVVNSKPSDGPLLHQVSRITPLAGRDDSATIATMSRNDTESESRSTETAQTIVFKILDEIVIRDQNDPVERENVHDDVTRTAEDANIAVLDFELDIQRTDIDAGYDRPDLNQLEGALDALEKKIKALEQEFRSYVDALNEVGNEIAVDTPSVEDRVGSFPVGRILAFKETDNKGQITLPTTVARIVASIKYIEVTDRSEGDTARAEKFGGDEPAFIEDGATTEGVTVFVHGGIESAAEGDGCDNLSGPGTVDDDGIPGADAIKVDTAAHARQGDGSRRTASQGQAGYTSEERAEPEMQAGSGGECCTSPTDLSPQDPVGGHRPHDVTLVGDEARIDAQSTTSPFSEGHTRRFSSVAT